MSTYALAFIANVSAAGLGAFLFSLAVTKDIKIMLQSIQKCASAKKSPTCALNELIEFIQYHADVKQLSKKKFSRPWNCPFSILKSKLCNQIGRRVCEFISANICKFVYVEPGYHERRIANVSNGISLVFSYLHLQRDQHLICPCDFLHFSPIMKQTR